MEKFVAVKAYPDSVNLVKPPNTTIPNTLPAEANNQYPTALLDDSGKKPFFGMLFSFPCALIVWLRLLNGEFLLAADSKAAVLLLNRMVFERFAFPATLTFCRIDGLCRRHR